MIMSVMDYYSRLLRPATLDILLRELDKIDDVDLMMRAMSLGANSRMGKAELVMADLTDHERRRIENDLATFEKVEDALRNLNTCAIRRDILQLSDNISIAQRRAWAFIDDNYDSENFSQVHNALAGTICSLIAANFAQLRSCACERGVMLIMWFDSTEHGESLAHLCRDCAMDPDVLSFWMRHLEAAYVPQDTYDPVPGFYLVIEPALYSEPAPIFADASLTSRPTHVVDMIRHHEKIRDRYDLGH
jgi:hypothetical protein